MISAKKTYNVECVCPACGKQAWVRCHMLEDIWKAWDSLLFCTRCKQKSAKITPTASNTEIYKGQRAL